VRLGNPNGAAALRRAGQGRSAAEGRDRHNADRHAQDLAPVVEEEPRPVSRIPLAAEGNARVDRSRLPPPEPFWPELHAGQRRQSLPSRFLFQASRGGRDSGPGTIVPLQRFNSCRRA
jgi:hypothetical protein